MNRLLVCLFVAYLAVAGGQETYTTQYNFDLEPILSNERLYKKYFDCLIGKGKCTPEGKELKERLPEALSTNCGKCSQSQKEAADRALLRLHKERPDDLRQILAIHDPKGKFWKNYKEQAKRQGIEISE